MEPLEIALIVQIVLALVTAALQASGAPLAYAAACMAFCVTLGVTIVAESIRKGML